MPKYHFNLFDDIATFDDEGAELPDIKNAEVYALRCARDMIAGQAIQGEVDLSHRIEVADDQGTVLRTVLFRDAVELVA